MQGVDQKQPLTYKANYRIFAASLCFFQVELSLFSDIGKLKTRLIYNISNLNSNRSCSMSSYKDSHHQLTEHLVQKHVCKKCKYTI